MSDVQREDVTATKREVRYPARTDYGCVDCGSENHSRGSTLCTERAVCVIEVGHPAGTRADWRSSTQPSLTVCDRHKGHYRTAYDDYSDLEPWEPIR